MCGNAQRGDPQHGLVLSGTRLEPKLQMVITNHLRLAMDVFRQVLQVLDAALSLNGSPASFTRETHLLGAIPELDSMAVVTLITTLEEHFGITVEDDEISGDTFVSVGSVVDFVIGKLGA